MSPRSLLQPYGYSSSTCGYCSPSGERSASSSSSKYGMLAPQMSVQLYQDLIDRGWRRSGTYVYHPDMARTCCPQYTIRLDALAFRPNKRQRQVVNRFNRFLETGLRPGEAESDGVVPAIPGAQDIGAAKAGAEKAKAKGKDKRKGKPFDFLDELFAYRQSRGACRFEMELVPAKALPETFELYKKYQVAVHKDKEKEVTARGFKRFLCDSPLLGRKIEYSGGSTDLPEHYGSYHLLYKVDGHSIGISVIDVLPAGVSSVYFIWDPAWAWAGLGKLSALYEVALVRRMREAGATGVGWLYMGYWIADCVKMRYKAEYEPSYLLDPGTNVFHPLSTPLETYLRAHPAGYRPFIDILALDRTEVAAMKPASTAKAGDMDVDVDEDEEGEKVDEWPDPSPPGMADPAAVDAGAALVYTGMNRSPIIPFEHYSVMLTSEGKRMGRELVAAVGIALVATMADLKGGRAMDKGMLYFA
ncbi:Arginyl-tRNA--protein transferase 1 [Cryptotrichosporon argae]